MKQILLFDHHFDGDTCIKPEVSGFTVRIDQPNWVNMTKLSWTDKSINDVVEEAFSSVEGVTEVEFEYNQVYITFDAEEVNVSFSALREVLYRKCIDIDTMIFLYLQAMDRNI